MECKCAERFIEAEKKTLEEWDKRLAAKHRETGLKVVEFEAWPEPQLAIEASCQQLCAPVLKLFDRLNFRQIESRFAHLLPDTPYAHAKKQTHSTSYSPNVELRGGAVARSG